MWSKLSADLRWLGVRLLVAIAAWAILYVGLNWHLTAQRDRALGWFKDNGIPTMPQDIAKDTVEPKDDAGPLWRAAAELFAAADLHAWQDQPLSDAELKDGRLVADFPDEQEEPNRPLNRPLTAAEIEQLHKVLANNQTIFDLLHQAVLRPGYNSPRDYTQGIRTALPDAMPSLNLAKFLRLAAEVSVYDGKLDRAIEFWTSLRAIQRWNDDEPILICQLVAADAENTLFNSVQRGLRAASFDDIQLGQIAALLQPVRDYREQVRTGMRGEFACSFNVTFDQMCTGQLLYVPGTKTSGAAGIARLMLMADQAVGLDYYRRTFESLKGDFLPNQVPDMQRDHVPWYAIMTGAMIPAISNIGVTFARIEAGRRITAWGVALRRHKLATGAYPDRLTDVRSEFAKAAGGLIDPFTAGPLVYRRQGEGFILYSVGANMADDGGRNERDRMPRGLADDIAFAMEK
jgi:hypothetical protein